MHGTCEAVIGILDLQATQRINGDVSHMDSANDRKAHEKTYGSFISMLKWVVPLLAVITAVIVVLISG